MQKTNFPLSSTTAKYNNMRYSLLLILVFSFINLFSPLAGFYMLFSAYIPQLLAEYGAYFYVNEGILLLYIIFVVIAILLLVPYLLCWIFSKKHVGWMIGALVFFSIDTLFFAVDFVSLLMIGEISYVLDLLFHIYALVSLILGVKYGLDMKKEAENAPEAPTAGDAATAEAKEALTGERQLTLTRKKSLVGCAMRMQIFVDGDVVCALKNGEKTTLTVPARNFALGAAFQNALVSNQIQVAEGASDIAYTLVLKSGMITNTIEFLPETI